MAELVWGEGSTPSDIMILGEAPGKNEQEQLRPFIGTAGQILNDALEYAGLKRDELFITNVYKTRPPGNRRPTADEINSHKEFLEQEIASVQPKFLLLLGNTALFAVTGKTGIARKHGMRVFPYVEPFIDFELVYATFHPAATVYHRSLRSAFLEDVRTFRNICVGDYSVYPKIAHIKSITEQIGGGKV